MRPKPYARGGCHCPNDVTDPKFATMLVPDIHSPNAIAMPTITAFLAVPVPPGRTALLAMSTLRAGPTGRAFLLQHHVHALPLCLVGEQMAGMACGPLVQLLIRLGANIQMVPNILDITDDHRLHALFVERGDQLRGLLMFDILDLVLDFLQLLLFGRNELFLSP